jgi:hypothetical protein
MNGKTIRKYQDKVLEKLAGRIDEFYLAGGTALSLFYFRHRLSVDLDFFTRNFIPGRVKEEIGYLEKTLSKRIELIGQNLTGKIAKILVYNIHFSPKDMLKLDFVEDTVELLKPAKTVEGIRILSLEDIFLRKLYAVCGSIQGVDALGRGEVLGGRISAKDFYDLYFLSHTFMSLSKFISEYGNIMMIEGLVRWFGKYDRMTMMDGVLELDISDKADYKKMEGHFKKEIDKIIESRLGET